MIDPKRPHARFGLATRVALLVILVAAAAACADEAPDETIAPPPEHEEASDLEPVPSDGTKSDAVGASFDRNLIVPDVFYTDANAMDASDMQAFLEDSPYGHSWLADESVGGTPVSELLVDVGRAHAINPLVLLARMQVEASLVSKSTRPSAQKVNFALGCGCHDGKACQNAFKGLEKQLDCGADVMRRLFDQSAEGAGTWRKGKTTRTLDRLDVTPANHATAALYGYTPWVLEGRGGNWLVWNITRRFERHVRSLGIGDFAEVPVQGWIGSVCPDPADCSFAASGEEGFCFDFVDPANNEDAGYCSLACEGFCPDRSGQSVSFCASLDGVNGQCVVKADALNESCQTIPGTAPQLAQRFIGSSSASPAEATVCLPK